MKRKWGIGPAALRIFLNHSLTSYYGCLVQVQVGNLNHDIEPESAGRQFEPYR